MKKPLFKGVWITEATHKILKTRAAHEGIPLNELIEKILKEYVNATV
jgi:predicted HicB family RNase H-like nuclease